MTLSNQVANAGVVDIADLIAMLHLAADRLVRHEEELTELDRAIGDGDHGRNMRIGFQAVMGELDVLLGHDPDLGDLLSHFGLILMSSVGGASGPLYGAAFTEAGLVLGGNRVVELPELTAAIEAACSGVARRGHCYPGDKTMLDTLQPAADALRTTLTARGTLAAALDQMCEAARQGMLSTIPLQARCGLAMRYGVRSIGHQDPGATSCYIILDALAVAWEQRRK